MIVCTFISLQFRTAYAKMRAMYDFVLDVRIQIYCLMLFYYIQISKYER